MSRSTSQEKRWTYITSAVILLSLVILVFTSLFFPPSSAPSFVLIFSYLVEIIASLCAAILSTLLSGFVKVKVKTRISKNTKLGLQAAGGLAVFVIVMMMSPRQQMLEVANVIFDAQLGDCRTATTTSEPSADAQGRCDAVISKYPNRPEPLFYLGRFVHRNSQLNPDRLAESRNYLQRAFDLYGISKIDSYETGASALSNYDLSVFRDIVYGLAIATADTDLRSFAVAGGSKNAAKDGLRRARELLRYAETLAQHGAGSEYKVRVLAALGVIEIYEAYLNDKLDLQVLTRAEKIFGAALQVKRESLGFQHYNVFMVAAHRAYAFGEEESVQRAKAALTKFIDNFLKSGLEDRRNASFEGRIEKWLTEIVDNSREDPFVITRPIGGRKIGGESMKKFFDAHTDLVAVMMKHL